MEFVWGGSTEQERVAVLAGSFNPPTVAHMELVSAAGFHVDEVVCVLPRVFPHKEYFGATMEQRLDMLQVAGQCLEFSIAITGKGLFIDIAREARLHYPQLKELFFLCGADAAERILTWDYGHPNFAGEMLQEFELLVAPRGKTFVPPPRYREQVHPLHIRDDYHTVSSTEVRQRVRSKQSWEHLVPEPIVEQVRSIYS